jgi:hypothetical protein
MIGEGRFMRAGTNVRATISGGPAFPITYDNTSANRVSVLTPHPDRTGWRHYPAVVSYANRRPGYVRVAGDGSEETDNTRIADTTARVDLTTALQRIEVSDQREWTVSIAPGAVCTLPGNHDLGGHEVRFVAEDGERPAIRFPPKDAAAPLTFAGGGACEFAGVDLAAQSPDGATAGTEPALLAVDGGSFDLAISDCSVSLTDEASNCSLLKSVGAPAVIDAEFAGVKIVGGHALFVEGPEGGSVIDCRAVSTTASGPVLERGVNGWLGERTRVLHSNIQPRAD